MKKRGVCNCGVDIKRNPHDRRICAPTLSKRLHKFARYLKDHRPGRTYNLTYGIQAKNGLYVTPFPASPWRGCIACGNPINGFVLANDAEISKSGESGEMCYACCKKTNNFAAVFCFYWMKEGYEHCIRPSSQMLSLCLLRLGVCVSV
jgi:hypothetical protein